LELNEDTKTHVNCGIEGAVFVHASDKNGEKVKNVEVILLKNNNIVAKNQTDEKGNTSIYRTIQFEDKCFRQLEDAPRSRCKSSSYK